MFNIPLNGFMKPSNNLEEVLKIQEDLQKSFNSKTIITGGFVRDLFFSKFPSDADMYIFDVNIKDVEVCMPEKLEMLEHAGYKNAKYYSRKDLDNNPADGENYFTVYPERLLGMLEYYITLPDPIEETIHPDATIPFAEFKSSKSVTRNDLKIQIMFMKGIFESTFFRDEFLFGTSAAFINNRILYMPNIFINDVTNKEFKVRNNAFNINDATEKYYKEKMLAKFPDFKVVQ
jgi:hypothetical protein